MAPSKSLKEGGAPSPIWRQARRVGAILGGTVLLFVGTVMLVIPGPGLVAILGGLVLLSSEVIWARHLLRKVRERVGDKVPLPGVPKLEEDKEE
jgi:drug/metabolite transporter (DMT)-like permease